MIRGRKEISSMKYIFKMLKEVHYNKNNYNKYNFRNARVKNNTLIAKGRDKMHACPGTTDINFSFVKSQGIRASNHDMPVDSQMFTAAPLAIGVRFNYVGTRPMPHSHFFSSHTSVF